jgi:hypothetical protein
MPAEGLMDVLRHSRKVAIGSGIWLLILALGAPLAYGQPQITVRVVDAKSGKPMRRLYAALWIWKGDTNEAFVSGDATEIVRWRYEEGRDGKIVVTLPPSRSSRAKILFIGETRTDGDGKISIQLPEDIPEKASISFSDQKFVAKGDFSPIDALRSGLVLEGSANNSDSKLNVSAAPGEVVIVGRKVSVWQIMLRAIP